MRVKLNVITSQLIRFARRSSTLTTLAHAAACPVASFLDYSYPRAPVTNKVFNFRCHWKHATHLGKFSRFMDMFYNFLETNLRKIAARRRDG